MGWGGDQRTAQGLFLPCTMTALTLCIACYMSCVALSGKTVRTHPMLPRTPLSLHQVDTPCVTPDISIPSPGWTFPISFLSTEQLYHLSEMVSPL